MPSRKESVTSALQRDGQRRSIIFPLHQRDNRSAKRDRSPQMEDTWWEPITPVNTSST